ncbi:hypothetical protein V8C86DRAFT_830474 [Haematococcus lacustris]
MPAAPLHWQPQPPAQLQPHDLPHQQPLQQAQPHLQAATSLPLSQPSALAQDALPPCSHPLPTPPPPPLLLPLHHAQHPGQQQQHLELAPGQTSALGMPCLQAEGGREEQPAALAAQGAMAPGQQQEEAVQHCRSAAEDVGAGAEAAAAAARASTPPRLHLPSLTSLLPLPKCLTLSLPPLTLGEDDALTSPGVPNLLNSGLFLEAGGSERGLGPGSEEAVAEAEAQLVKALRGLLHALDEEDSEGVEEEEEEARGGGDLNLGPLLCLRSPGLSSGNGAVGGQGPGAVGAHMADVAKAVQRVRAAREAAAEKVEAGILAEAHKEVVQMVALVKQELASDATRALARMHSLADGLPAQFDAAMKALTPLQEEYESRLSDAWSEYTALAQEAAAVQEELAAAAERKRASMAQQLAQFRTRADEHVRRAAEQVHEIEATARKLPRALQQIVRALRDTVADDAECCGGFDRV